MIRPQTFQELIDRIDEQATFYAEKGNLPQERLMRKISQRIAFCYAQEMSLWMERMHNLEVQRNKAIESLGKSITSDFEERLSVIEEELAEKEN